MVNAAKLEGIDYISPFWTMQFFGYVDYTSSTAVLSYQDLATSLASVASQNILSNQFSSTGIFYGQLAGNVLTSTSTTTAPATQPAATTVALRDRPTVLVLIAGLVAAIAIAAAVVLSRRR
jgi:hypothetical protein